MVNRQNLININCLMMIDLLLCEIFINKVIASFEILHVFLNSKKMVKNEQFLLKNEVKHFS